MSRGRFSGLSTVAAIVVTVVLCTAAVGQSQNVATCANSLTPCANYLNSTNPPAECCTPLKKALTTQKECLCNLYKDPTVLNSFGINVTKALDLPKHCNISANISNCNTTSSASPSPGTTGTPATSSPGRTTGNNSSDGGSSMAWTGLSTLLMSWSCMMLDWMIL